MMAFLFRFYQEFWFWFLPYMCTRKPTAASVASIHLFSINAQNLSFFSLCFWGFFKIQILRSECHNKSRRGVFYPYFYSQSLNIIIDWINNKNMMNFFQDPNSKSSSGIFFLLSMKFIDCAFLRFLFRFYQFDSDGFTMGLSLEFGSVFFLDSSSPCF